MKIDEKGDQGQDIFEQFAVALDPSKNPASAGNPFFISS